MKINRKNIYNTETNKTFFLTRTLSPPRDVDDIRDESTTTTITTTTNEHRNSNIYHHNYHIPIISSHFALPERTGTSRTFRFGGGL